MLFCRSKTTRREQIPWRSKGNAQVFSKTEKGNQFNTKDQYYKSSPLRQNKLLTFTSRRITLFLIPQSTATTFVGFPLPYTLTSCHFNKQRVRGKYQPWATCQYHKHIWGCFALILVTGWLLTTRKWLAVNNQFIRHSECHKLYLFYEGKGTLLFYIKCWLQ